jgi:hypothetical protein
MEVRPHRGAGGAGQDPPSMLMFLHYVVSNSAAPLCAVPIHSPFFWSAVPTWARFREVTQRHEMTILGAPPAVFASAALLSSGITGFACTEKWYTSKRLAGFPHGSAEMCDYSLQHVRSRPAKVGDKLTTRDFGTGTRGFAASEDAGVAVCVLPGTELSFAGEIASRHIGPLGWRKNLFNHRTAIFRQINKEKAMAHHDALEFPDGQILLLTLLGEGQQATVLQLPAEPKTTAPSVAQQRAVYVG